jgi:hypothetical protein
LLVQLGLPNIYLQDWNRLFADIALTIAPLIVSVGALFWRSEAVEGPVVSRDVV